MTKIVLEHYPVANLPDDIRAVLPDGHADVRVTIEQQVANPGRLPPLSAFRHLAKPRFDSMDEIVAQVRGLRDEWDSPGDGGT